MGGGGAVIHTHFGKTERTGTYLLVVLAVFGHHVSQHADSVVYAAAVLLLDEVVNFPLARFQLWRIIIASHGRERRSQRNVGFPIYIYGRGDC